ncbi:2'-5' RNA ligase family protein [Devosia albogilva]|uniref:2'-5' RNA ligase family protein n=1 Tax=Devosia albogilva TaxID=429726 RepID=A0ABW5QHJ8_9HYPH
MPFALCLRIDDVAERNVAELWRKMAEENVSRDMLDLGYAPHVTLVVLDAAPDAASLALARAKLKSLECVVGEARRFDDTDIVWLAVDGGEVLFSLHGQVAECFPETSIRQHYRAGAWTPHLTMHTSGAGDRVLKWVHDAWYGPQTARFMAAEFVEFPPVRVLLRDHLN